LLAGERRKLYENRELGKEDARTETLNEWQSEWSLESEVCRDVRVAVPGAWTRKIIPNIGMWFRREHGTLSYHLTQMLSGHGCFEAYLHRIGKADNPQCVHCDSGEIDDAEHTLLKCKKFSESRRRMMQILSGSGIEATYVDAEKIVNCMLESQEKWNAVDAFATEVINEKERNERERKVLRQHAKEEQ